MSLHGRIIDISTGDVVTSNVSDTSDDWDATTAYVNGDEVAYGGRVYVSVPSIPTFTIAQASGVDTTNDYFIKGSHGLVVGDRVAFTSSTTLPGSISATTLYYVIAPPSGLGLSAANAFSVSTTDGGAAVNISSTGTGTLTVYRNPNFGTTPGTDNAIWLDSRAVNRYAMFDGATLTKTSNASSIATTVTPGDRFDCLALLGLNNASVVQIAAYTSGGSNNKLLNSEGFSAADWTTAALTVTTNAATSPNGAVTADKLIPSVTNTATHRLYQAAQAVTSGASVTFSVWLKSAGYTYARLRCGNSADTSYFDVYVDLTAGTIGTPAATGTGAAVTGATIEDFGDGWWRVTLTGSVTTVTNYRTSIFVFDNSGGTSFAGAGSNGIYAFGAQVNTGAVANYNHTTASSQVTYHYFKAYDLTDTAFDDNWYVGTYSPALYYDRLAVSDIEPLASATFMVNIIGSGTVECGSCLPALSNDIGGAQYGAEVGIDNWSRVERDEWGGLQIDSTRSYSDNATYECFVAKNKAAALRRLFATYKDTPSLYLMAPNSDAPGGWDGLGVHHAIASFRIILSYPEHYLIRLELEGMT